MNRAWLRRGRFLILVALALAAAAMVASAASSGQAVGHETYAVHNLVSDDPSIPADRHDPNLVNAWGITAGPMTPWWVADNETDRSTLYNGDGVPQPPPPTGPLVVTVDGGPTGTVFNGTSGFVVSSGGASGPARFLFASEDGVIRGWNPGVPPGPPTPSRTAVVAASTPDAIYKGLAIGSVGTSTFLYATDFHHGQIDVFDSSFAPVTTMPFVDPGIPAGFAPFGIQNIGGTLFVTYAKQDADAEDEVDAQSLGFVDMFATDGTFLGRVATRGQLDAPWGLAMAPADFGRFSGDLLVGNFGNGRINAYAQAADGTWSHTGQLRTADHKPLTIDGLWGIGFGNGSGSGARNALYFAAGPDDESHGLFGRITASQ
jgi:uncharacterized protein (TIGR03118 family)